MIHRIHHTAISTPDLDRLVAFYTGLLGFEVVDELAWPKGTAQTDAILGVDGTAARMAMLRHGDSMIELFEFSEPAARPQPENRPVIDHGITHLCFLVDDLRAEHERLSSAGMVFHCPPHDDEGGVAITYGRDPDGNVIELMQVRDPQHPFHVAV